MPINVTRGLGGTLTSYGGIPSQTYTIWIGGQQVLVVAGSLKIDMSIGRRSQCTFYCHTDINTQIQQYTRINIYDTSGTLVFSGYVNSAKAQQMGFQKSLYYQINAIDQHFLADKRIIAQSFQQKTCGSIATTICKTILAQEGVTIGQIYDGLMPPFTPSTTIYPQGNVGPIPNVTFAYQTVASALDSLVTEASSAGVPYFWAIDQNKKFYFTPYTANPNTLTIDGTWVDQKGGMGCYIQRGNPKYRNRQWLVGGMAQTDFQYFSFIGDGSTQSWTMPYQLAPTAPTITVNGAYQQVELKGTPGGVFFWAGGDAVIAQDSKAVPLGPSQRLDIIYVGQYPSVVATQNNAQIGAQARIDGTSGLIEVVDTDHTLTDVATANIEAAQLLQLYGQSGSLLTFETQVPGYAPGQLVTVNLPGYALNNAQMLIETVSISDQKDGYNIWYQINCVAGPYDTTWVQFFSKLLLQQVPAVDITVGTTSGLQLPLNSMHDGTIRLNMHTNAHPSTPSAKVRFVSRKTNTKGGATRFKISVGGKTILANKRDGAIRFSMPKPTQNTRYGGIRLLTKSSTTINPITQGFSATMTTPSANISVTITSTGGGGGSTGFYPSKPPTGKMFLYEFGNDMYSTTNVNNQRLRGTNLLMYWSQIETSDGNRDWTQIDNKMQPWVNAGKKIILRISQSGHHNWNPPYSGQGTPQWVYSLGVTKLTESDGSVYPQYWNTTYLAKLQAFIMALGQRYDGDSRIEYIQIATGDGGEANVDTNKTSTLAKWQAIGYTDPVWRDTSFKIMGFYSAAFKKTPLCWMGDKTYIGNSGAPFNEGNMVLWCTGQTNGLGTSPYQPSGSLPRLWLQNNGIGTNSTPDPRWLLTTIGCEQLTNTSQSGNTLDGDMAAMVKYGATYGLIFDSDVSNSSNDATLAKYNA